MQDLIAVENIAKELSGRDDLVAGFIDGCPVIRIQSLDDQNIGHAWYDKDDWTILNTYVKQTNN